MHNICAMDQCRSYSQSTLKTHGGLPWVPIDSEFENQYGHDSGSTVGSGSGALRSVAQCHCPWAIVKGMFWRSTPNVFSFLIRLLLTKTMPLFSLMSISNTLNPFLLCWGLLKWFLFYNILYLLCIFTFSKTTPLFVFLLFFFFFLFITIQSLLLPAPIETT